MVLGKGEYHLIDKYRHLEVGENYYRMTTSQKEALRMEFFTCRRVESNILQEAVDRENTEFASPSALSVQPENSKILTVPYSVLTELFADAGHILDSQNSLVQAPMLTLETGKEELFFVASKEDPSKPHSVKFSDTGRVTCDQRCIRWARHNICSHTVAVAEKRQMLAKYLQWFRNRKKTGTLTKMAEVGAPKNSGQKNKATQRRKERSNTTVTAPPPRFPQNSRIPTSDQFPVGIQDNTTFPPENTTVSPSLLAQPHTDPLHLPPHSLPLTIPLHPDSVSSSSSSTRQELPLKPDPPPGLVEVTLLHLCDPRVSTCYGCSQPIRSAGVHVPPPADLVVVTKMRRDFVVAGEKRPGKLGNVYFHAHMSCIRSTLAHFLPSLLTVKTHVRQLLTPLHRQHLIDSLGFSA